MSVSTSYEAVIGLEVHIQLLTKSKLFCGDSAAFGGDPNTHISPVTMAHPGTLPVLNKKAVEYAIRLGVALQCEITRHSFFDRKHYFYPDLPKAYQTSQMLFPICMGGQLGISNQGAKSIVQIHHIHLEEDAGKSIHDAHPDYTCIDLNRAGVPLLELVTDPVIRSADEAFAFLTELRKLVRWLGICDGNMEEGSLRCDANISIRPVGETKLGTKVEVKNLNSIRNVKRAIEGEIQRQVMLTDKGGKIIQQTRGYDADNNTTAPQRDKEEANDYRYFPCPDLPPFEVSNSYLDEIKAALPELPEQILEKYISILQLPEQDAKVLSEEKSISDYFNQLIKETPHTKAAANWMLGPVKNWLNENNATIESWPVSTSSLAALIELVQGGKVNFSTACAKILPILIQQPGADPLAIATGLNLLQDSNEDELAVWVNEVIAAMPDKVQDYKKGKKGLIGLFVGEVKKRSKGKADPQKVTALLQDKLQ
ncbi:MAG: Asp-tRNA(Asn)/Glu-tRNA(Gln) amidotransferase subunit GatB [Chitinophagaceae bacterium]